jgi:hypothetical protein
MFNEQKIVLSIIKNTNEILTITSGPIHIQTPC